MSNKIEYADFAFFASSKGYIACVEGSAFVITTFNGVKVELKQSRKPVYTIGYGRNKQTNENIRNALGTKFGEFDVKSGGYFNVASSGAGLFWQLVSDIEKIGTIEKTKNKVTEKSETPKLIKVKPVPFKNKPKITHLTVEEINDIKSKNLDTIKKVGKKYVAYRIVNSPATYIDNFDIDKARMCVDDAIAKDIEAFNTPDHLSKEDLKVLL